MRKFFKSGLLSHCSHAASRPSLPPSLPPLSAHSGNEARSRVSSSGSNGGDGSYIHLKTCCARGECFSQRANSSDRNFSLLVRLGRREVGGLMSLAGVCGCISSHVTCC